MADNRTGTQGRLDLVIDDHESGQTVAIVEIKGAAEVHGDQLDRYLEWAEKHDPQPKLFLCAFDNDESPSDPAWTRRRLQDIFSPWKNSQHPHAAWLADGIVKLLSQWDIEADGPLGQRTGHYVVDIVAKRLGRELDRALAAKFEDDPWVEVPENKKGGKPSIMSWIAHPRYPKDCDIGIGVELRTPGRRDFSSSWQLRPNIEVTPWSRDLKTSRLLAFDLAHRIHSVMGREHIVDQLVARGQLAAAEAIQPRQNDGFNRPVAGFSFEHWPGRIAREETYPGGGVFYHDKGIRLATIIEVDVTELLRRDLQEMIVSIIEILHAAAR